MKDQGQSIWRETAAQWQSEVVARSGIGKFTGNMYTRHYLANQDSLGTGPKGAFRCGRKIAYPKQSLVDWLEEKMVKGEANPVKGKRTKGAARK